jgi:integrase
MPRRDPKKKLPPFKNGIRRTGERAPDGRPLFELRLTAPHPDRPGEKLVDSIRTRPAKGTAEAQALKDQLTQEELARKLGQVRSHKARPFSEVADEYIAGIDRYGTATSWGSFAKKLKAEFGEMYLDKIQVAHMQRFVTKLPYSRSTVKGVRQVLKNVYQHGVEHGDAAMGNRALQVMMPKEKRSGAATLARLESEAPVKKGLTQSELVAFMDAFKAKYSDRYCLVLVMVATGGRFSEISALQHGDIDMVTGALVIRRAQVAGRKGPPKKDKARPGAIPRTVLAELEKHIAEMAVRQWVGHDLWLFPGPTRAGRRFLPVWSRSGVGKAIKATMRGLGISTVTATHFARHTLNGLLMGHVTDALLRKVIGHTTEQQSVAYGDAEVLSFAVEVDKRLLGAGGNPDGSDGGEDESK